ncbi:MAG: formimidoylglutamate deiminase [Woeseiaceae bacterium]|nr:formimidoylglutamate deiminase [Woeseiaceae bacterium]
MQTLFAEKALTPAGWADRVRLGIADGRIAAVTAGAAPAAGDERAGLVIPGLVNAHSHAFQRALAGRTEQRSPRGEDDFWTWRSAMYTLAGNIDAEALRAVATQLYCELLEAGYTTVAEFHYLHGGPADALAMFAALEAAAETSGIRLLYLPVLYERAGFGADGPTSEQRRFALGLDDFLAHHAAARARCTQRIGVGIAAHSLRAVSEASLEAIAAAGQGGPLHLHVAEQQREVDECLAATGRRPVRRLLERFDVGPGWCLVHATHMDADETRDLARSGAVVCLCPGTEANLGDGLFPLAPYLAAGGRIAIGSDSQVTIDPFEELRWLEYGQRLVTRSRNVAAGGDPHVGQRLFLAALEGGAQAAGQPEPGLAPGAPADLVELDATDPVLAGHAHATLLDALVFSGYRPPVERVMVAGEWRVAGGRHEAAEKARAAFRTTIDRLWSAR